MRILIVANKGSNHAKKVAEGLVDRGHNVYFASPNDNIDISVPLNHRIKLDTLPYRGKLGYILNSVALRKLYNKIRPDIVNVHYASGCGLLCHLAGLKPVVLSCYGSDIFEFPQINCFNKLLLRQILNSADAIASTSHAMAVEIRDLLLDQKKEITITPFGINTNLFFPFGTLQSHKKKVIGIVKSLSPIYDIPLLLNSIRVICNRNHADIVLRIYGDGPQKQDLEKLTEELGISDFVMFMGRIPNDEIPKVLNEMDIFVNCSKQESFGVNILEAMACGIPVVATDCVGPREIMIDGETGIIVKDRNPESIADAIISLLDDDQKRNKMGRAGRKHVCSYYDWNNNVKDLERVLYDNRVFRKQ